MELIQLEEKDKQKYNTFVMSQPSGPFLQSWDWGEWQKALGHEVFRFILQNNGETICATQFIKTKLAGGQYYLYAPYGPVGENVKELIDELKKKFIDAIFFRIEPQQKIDGLEKFAVKSVNIQPAITMIVDIAKPDEQLLAAMHTKTRYNIKVAQRHEVEIQSELMVTPRHGLYVRDAINEIVKTQERQKYRGHPLSYYQKLIDFFAVHNTHGDLKLSIYKALYQKQLVASAIMIDFGKTRMYLYGGSSEEHRNVMAPYLMHWRAIEDARNLGLTHYDLGGSEVASGGERGFTRFKQGFGGRVVEYAGAYDIICNKLWYNSYKIFRKLNRGLKQIIK